MQTIDAIMKTRVKSSATLDLVYVIVAIATLLSRGNATEGDRITASQYKPG